MKTKTKLFLLTIVIVSACKKESPLTPSAKKESIEYLVNVKNLYTNSFSLIYDSNNNVTKVTYNSGAKQVDMDITYTN